LARNPTDHYRAAAEIAGTYAEPLPQMASRLHGRGRRRQGPEAEPVAPVLEYAGIRRVRPHDGVGLAGAPMRTSVGRLSGIVLGGEHLALLR
jgi:hypothetical protein